MISLKDYNLLYSDTQNDLLLKKNHKFKVDLPFYYLYPSDTEPSQKCMFVNEKQQIFTVSQLQDLQECEKVIELIVSKDQVFSPSQEFFAVEHKNPNSERRFLVISSIDRQHTLKHIAQNCFFENAKVPDEEFCSHLIERILLFAGTLEQKGLHLKIITPEHIIIFESEFYLAYPFPHDLSDSSVRVFEQLYQNEKFCAPQILRVINNCKTAAKQPQDETANTTNIFLNPVTVSNSLQVKSFKKSILYSLALTIFYLFGHSIPPSDRYSALRNPRYLNNHLNQLRKEIKIHHDGKYISKLLKLMLEHSESLRDTIKTFLYKMNSVQFQLLKRFVQKKTNNEQENIRTESEINSNPMLRTSSGKKTIDIRISSMSNASSLINRSWLSASQRDASRILSPFETGKNLPDEKDNLQKSKHSMITPNNLNEIEEEKNNPGSPIEFDIDWDEDNSIRESSKSSRSNQKNSKSSSDKEKNLPPTILLNKISQKEEGEEQGEGKAEENQKKEKEKQNDVESQIRISLGSINSVNPTEKTNEDQNIFRTQTGNKAQKCLQNHFRTEPQIKDHTLSESDRGQRKKSSKKHTQNYEAQKHEVNEKHETTTQELIEKTKILKFPELKFQEQDDNQMQKSSDLHDNPKIQKFQSHPLSHEATHQPSQVMNQSTTFQLDPDLPNNESIIFQQSFGDGEQYQAHQKFLKDAKSKEKKKLTERKKDQYNQRSRVILVTLVVIYAVFWTIQWFVSRQKTEE